MWDGSVQARFLSPAVRNRDIRRFSGPSGLMMEPEFISVLFFFFLCVFFVFPCLSLFLCFVFLCVCFCLFVSFVSLCVFCIFFCVFCLSFSVCSVCLLPGFTVNWILDLFFLFQSKFFSNQNKVLNIESWKPSEMQHFKIKASDIHLLNQLFLYFFINKSDVFLDKLSLYHLVFRLNLQIICKIKRFSK